MGVPEQGWLSSQLPFRAVPLLMSLLDPSLRSHDAERRGQGTAVPPLTPGNGSDKPAAV